MRRVLATTTVTALALALAACGSGNDSGDGSTTLHVAAAASLTRPFEQIATAYEKQHRGVQVELQFAGSSDLATQVVNGAQIDVFASADTANMDKVGDAITGDPAIFATNTLTIITEPGNPKKITGLKDLERSDLAVVVCAPQVPCGTATQMLMKRQHVTIDAASEEAQVTDVLTKVTTGEADAGLVYVTDATGAGDAVDTVATKGADQVVNTYPIAPIAGNASPDEAQAFVDHVTGPEGQKVLKAKGFGAP
ncbi:molybdate-binding protein [Janibacter sp. Soil728]|uniref:molybdate ABC transporter substrate-binding protein n=1 Tax=Janibacter sp. Soil728 TaxID=1736393 RepID=UPI0006F941E7|nr:molybdate ABC transporter substrate-binding protein [Janibacter sp. Soil728]KRE36056.1 molybdate-binding protein [Janibacter sp. Soil728]